MVFKPGSLQNCTVWTAKRTRDTFIQFFRDEEHVFWHSSPVVPFGDPTLLFVNAGMNQFKPHFLGSLDPTTAMSKLKRAVNSQKCIRAGGKHNDLEDVGKDTYHHTFFEMLGNWSFADYFKQEAIDFAVKALVGTFGLDKSRLYATYYGGDPKIPNCPADLEAKDCWLRHLPEERVLPFGYKDNFWEMAETGPCGPCSEIHYDRIGGRDASSLVNQDDPNVLEIWNLVFMQFNRELGGILTPLPSPCVDTGMGFERLLSILQNKTSNYDTDLFTPIFSNIKTVTGVQSDYGGKVSVLDDLRIDMSYRVIADHIRCLSVAIADGAEPSNEGRGYVLRRILRRALRYGKQFLSASDKVPWLYLLVDAVSDSLGDFFSELRNRKEYVKQIILEEENLFNKTLDRGVKRFNQFVARPDVAGTKSFPGKHAFTLYTSYGFPLDLTQLMAEELGMTVDTEGFDIRFKEHQLISENKNFKVSEEFNLGPEQLHEIKTILKLPRTDDSLKYLVGGYSPTDSFPANIVAIWDGDSFLASSSSTEKPVAFILDRSCFYAEMGGQVCDNGLLASPAGEDQFIISEVRKFGDYVLHVGSVSRGNFSTADPIVMKVDPQRRFAICQNHTATHLLNFTLRKVLGGSCDQKGSIVEPHRLRFDFSHGSQIELNSIQEIEEYVKKMICEKLEVFTMEVPLKHGNDIKGLRAVFGESYPDPVRVVSVGLDVNIIMSSLDENHGSNVSIEFCGGTHVSNSEEIEDFVILSEESISKGVRRIVALCGPDASKCTELLLSFEAELKSMQSKSSEVDEGDIKNFRIKVEELKNLPYIGKRKLLQDIDSLLKVKVAAEKQMVKARLHEAKSLGTHLANVHKESQFAILNLETLKGDGKALDVAAQAFASENSDAAALLISASNHGGACICLVPKNCSLKINATDWLNTCLSKVNGKGGGNAHRAVGASRDMSSLDKAIEAAKLYVQNCL